MAIPIYISGDIDFDSHKAFSESLAELYYKNVKRIHLEVSSDGGDTYAGLAFYDTIKMYEKAGIMFSTKGTGIIASAATLAFIACPERRMTENAWFMVHEDSVSGIEDMKLQHIEKEVIHGRKLEDQWNGLLAKNTMISLDKWTELSKNETYLSAKECLDLGIIKEIV